MQLSIIWASHVTRLIKTFFRGLQTTLIQIPPFFHSRSYVASTLDSIVMQMAKKAIHVPRKLIRG